MRKFSTAVLFTSFLSTSSQGEVDFAHDVLPILKAHCIECHTNGKYKGGFSMDTRETILESDEAVIEGDAENSMFIQLLTAEDPDDRMPQKADPLSPEQVATLTAWVNEGLPWEPGLSFREKKWQAPLAPRLPELPPAQGALQNPIDRIAMAYFKTNNVTAPQGISDAAFLRRVSLDLVGLLPSPSELSAFEKSPDANKRAAKVTELLNRNTDYADHWMTFWNDLLRNDYAGTGFIDGGRKQITGWLYAALQNNKPYDQFVSELLSPGAGSEGFIKGIKWRGDVNASQVEDIQYAQNVSQVFFGENMKCASCHDSFINDWKLEDAYGMAAIIAGKPLEMFRCDKPTGQFAEAKFLFDSLGEIDRTATREQKLKRAAELATTKENGRLARTIVNRLWARLMGRGMVEPVDIMGNRPWSEDMLDFLGWDLAENGYDLKQTLAMIANSRVYQSETVTPPTESENYIFHGPIAKRLTAEQFIDAVWEITGTKPGAIDADVKRSGGVMPGKWIWSEGGNRPAGEAVVFTREFSLPEKTAPAKLLITCDNEYSVTVNGKAIGGDANWETLDSFDVSPHLKPGSNTIQIDAKNLGAAPNPAALYVYLQAEPFVLTSEKQWRANGKPAMEVAADAWSPTIQNQISAHLSTSGVRASLVKTTLLMRALGRPNREQVVTTRPEELTTLQALELNNGAEFDEYLNRGADVLIKKKNMINDLYLSAISRLPSSEEMSVALEILGTDMSKESVADFLWTVLMLPEFQFVR